MMKNTCKTCRYMDVSAYSTPCSTCEIYSAWEPIDQNEELSFSESGKYLGKLKCEQCENLLKSLKYMEAKHKSVLDQMRKVMESFDSINKELEAIKETLDRTHRILFKN